MNIFRFIADMLHVVAITLLIYRIKKSRNCIGKYCSKIKAAVQPTNQIIHTKDSRSAKRLFDKFVFVNGLV